MSAESVPRPRLELSPSMRCTASQSKGSTTRQCSTPHQRTHRQLPPDPPVQLRPSPLRGLALPTTVDNPHSTLVFADLSELTLHITPHPVLMPCPRPAPTLMIPPRRGVGVAQIQPTGRSSMSNAPAERRQRRGLACEGGGAATASRTRWQDGGCDRRRGIRSRWCAHRLGARVDRHPPGVRPVSWWPLA
jgi:hypothetical protein